jgi:transcriptional antiterminator RfaH
MGSWYAVFTKPRKEAVARENLERQGFTAYLPMLRQPRHRRGRWVEVVEPLFPRYLFVELRLGVHDISPIRSTLGVSGLVRFGPEPAVVPRGFVESLRAAEDQAAGCHMPKDELFKRGDRVTIVAGPFAGTQAIFDEPSGEGRVILLLDFLGRANRVRLATDQIVGVAA